MFKHVIPAFLLFMLSLPINAKNSTIKIIVAADMPEITNTKGSYPELATLLKQVRQLDPSTFFVFGGASIGPSSMSAFDRGTHIIDVLNMLEPDVMAITKREFSYFEDELSLRAYEAAFPFVSTNLSFIGQYKNFGGLRPWVLVERQGIKLGVISVIDPSVIAEYRLTKVAVEDPLKAIKLNAAQLRQHGADAILLMYSEEFSFVKQLLKDKVVDVAILANQQTKRLPSFVAADFNNNIYLNEEASAIEVDLQWLPESKQMAVLSVKKHRLINYTADVKVKERVQEYLDRLSRLLDEKIGVFKTSADSRIAVLRKKESSFANFITDSLREFFQTDIAMINGGAIRGNRLYSPNEVITRRDMAIELPFRAQVEVIEISGAILVQAIEHGLSQIENSRGRFLHFSGARIEFDSTKPAYHRLLSVTINGELLNEQKIYTVVTTDYLASGGDGFSMLIDAPRTKLNTQVSPLLLDVIVNAIRSEREISPILDGRLVDLHKENL
jgi:2',3'-cyclic-nucleotide 2'-phosphodiesterase (5'-nucleotidase family)